MISFSEYESFFEALATDYKPISHSEESKRFAIMDIDDIISDQRGQLDFTFPCMILENSEGALAYKHDRMLDEMDGAFHILQQVNRGNPSEKRQVMNTTKAIGLAIIARIQRMKEKRSRGVTTVPRLVLYFQMNRVQYQKVSNVFGGSHGWRFEFTIGQEDPIEDTESDWYSND